MQKTLEIKIIIIMIIIPSLSQKTRLVLNITKRTSHLVDFPVRADDNLKVKKIENLDKCKDLTSMLKKLRYMKVTMIQIVVGTLDMIPGELEIRKKSR